MLHALLVLAAEEGAEPSKTAFYILAGALVLFAVLLAGLGMSRADFPKTAAQQRGVLAIGVLLVAGTMAATVATS